MTTVNYSYLPGWNAGARTSAGLLNNGRLTFSVGQAVGIVCGLNSVNSNQDYVEIHHGFYISNKKYKIVERGLFKTTFASFNAEAIFKIERINKVVRYYVDGTLVYTSLALSDGFVFGDCSLFFYLDSIFDATITALNDVDRARVVLSFDAKGAEGNSNYATIELGPISIVGIESDINSASIKIGPVWSIGIEGDKNWGTADIGPLLAAGSEDLLIPDYSVGTVKFGPIYAYGYEGQIGTTEANIALGPIWAVGAEGNPSWGYVKLGPVHAFGYSFNRRYLTAEWPAWTADIRSVVAPLYIVSAANLNWPNWVLSAAGEIHDGVAVLYWPASSLIAHSGGTSALTWPLWNLIVEGLIERVGVIELTWPELILSSEALVGSIGEIDLVWPLSITIAYGGDWAALVWLPSVLSVEGEIEIIGRSILTRPQWLLVATGLTGSVGTIEFDWLNLTILSTGVLGGVGVIILRWPHLALVADSGINNETTYAVNLTNGAVTQLFLGMFDKLVTAHGKIYGLQDGVLSYLDGSTDQGVEIPMTIRFASQQFGTYLAKSIDGAIYLNARENDGVSLTLVQDETALWTYKTDTDTSPAFGTHKVKIGRGIIFHSLGMILENKNGGALTIGGIEVPVLSLTRKPR